MITRRGFFEAAGGALVAAAGSRSPRAAPGGEGKLPRKAFLLPALPAGTQAEASLEILPGKKPLIKLAYRPPNYEAPLTYLRSIITPNDEFFVRYHLADIPQVEASAWRLKVGGEGANREVQIGIEELKKLTAFEVVAVCQCAGNRRGLFQPHVPGVQWGNGAVGCARWKGARLKEVLKLVGLKENAVEVVLDGADGPVHDKTPDFVKSLPVWKAVEETTLVAYEMNGELLPHWNGFPARIVVPGWAATYWVKHLTTVTAVTKPFDGYWMKEGYRVPAEKFPLVERFVSQETAASAPMTEILVNSFITSHEDGARIRAGSRTLISGIAWDAGYGLSAVEISADGGKSWSEAKLGDNHGKYAFRGWSHEFIPRRPGKLSFAVRATNKLGQTQATELIENPAGYNNNVVQTLTFDVV